MKGKPAFLTRKRKEEIARDIAAKYHLTPRRARHIVALIVRAVEEDTSREMLKAGRRRAARSETVH